MARESTDPSTPGAHASAPLPDAVRPDLTQGVPIVPGVPLLPDGGPTDAAPPAVDSPGSPVPATAGVGPDPADAGPDAVSAAGNAGEPADTGAADIGAAGTDRVAADPGDTDPAGTDPAGIEPDDARPVGVVPADPGPVGPAGAGGPGTTGPVPATVTALAGEAATALNGVHLNAFAVPVSTVPPSTLQGPTLSVPAPLPADALTTSGLVTRGAAVPTTTDGWTPSGTRSPRTTSTARDDLPPAPGPTAAAAERTSRREKDLGPEPASALTADRLLVGPDRPPVSGWRRWLYSATFGRINVGDSDAVRSQRALEHRISARLGGRTRYVPVLSRKGGVGKTTVTTLLGMALADIREDRIIAMDANPDRGTLSDRSPGRADHTARQLVQNRYTIDSFAQLAGYVTRDGSRLHVLASDTDPAVAQAFDDSDYRAVTDLLSRYYSIVLTDSGTGMVHSVMKGTLEKADSVVLVSGGSVDEARLASETLSWLEAHGRQDLVKKAIVVINLSSGNGTQVDVGQIEQHFRSRVSTVVRIPYDRHLAEGSRVDLSRLNPATRRAVTELAALVVDQLAA
ncbi:MinD/ParA family protein [Arthrobacter sp. Leaf234]|uniref:MinD/ParA family ATP-binding protein n=1 Tax=Arthrobacter sp. Leaf234 TaxID=1736303 RepID=UPI0009EA6435|nr:MinD/ParA family protein [Arthrobacter sp. Leaf234]